MMKIQQQIRAHAIAATMIGTKTLFARDALVAVRLERRMGPDEFAGGVGF